MKRKPKILLAGMPWTEFMTIEDHTKFQYPHNLDLMIKYHSEEFEFIFDHDSETYGSHTADEDIDLCLAIHGNRDCDYMKDRFKYLDSICDNVWIIHESYLKDYILIDRSGYKGGSTLARPDISLNVADDMDDEKCAKFVDALYAEHIVPNLTDDKSQGEGYILFAGQMPDDSSIPASLGTRIYAEVVIKALNRLDSLGIPIIYKPHPKMDLTASEWGRSQEEIIKDLVLCGKWNNIKIVTDVAICDLVANSLCVISVCSGSNFEAALMNKPSFNLGKSDLKDFVYTVDDPDEFLDIHSLIDQAIRGVQLNRYIYTYVTERLMECKTIYLYSELRRLVSLRSDK